MVQGVKRNQQLITVSKSDLSTDLLKWEYKRLQDHGIRN